MAVFEACKQALYSHARVARGVGFSIQYFLKRTPAEVKEKIGEGTVIQRLSHLRPDLQ